MPAKAYAASDKHTCVLMWNVCLPQVVLHATAVSGMRAVGSAGAGGHFG